MTFTTPQIPQRGVLLLALALGGAAPAHGVDLLEIYALAQEGDPQYRQALASRRAAQELRPQALARLLPAAAFRADAFTNHQDIKTSQFDPNENPVDKINFNSHGYTLDLAQPLFRGDRIMGYLQAGNHLRRADAELAAAEQDLIMRAAAAYFDVLAAYDNLNFADTEKKSLARQLEQAQQRFDVGLTAITDVQEAQAGYDQAVALEIEAKNNVDNAREALREITGRYFSGLAVLDASRICRGRFETRCEYISGLAALNEAMPLAAPEPGEIETWTATALEQNPGVIAAQYAVDISRQEIKRRRAGHLPAVDLVARHDLSKSGGRFGTFESAVSSVGVQLNVPIFQGGYVHSRAREARRRLELEQQRLEQARRRAQRMTRQAYLGIISGISRVKALKQAVVSSETALRATEAGFEVGTRTAVDVVAAERLASQARRNYARARYDYLLSTLRLKQAAGALAGKDLDEVNRWLN